MIEQYLNGALPDAELERFRARCRSDREFALEAALQKAARDAVLLDERKNLDSALQSPEIQEVKAAAKQRLSYKKRLYPFLIGLLLLAAGFGARWFFYVFYAPDKAPVVAPPPAQNPSAPQLPPLPQTIPQVAPIQQQPEKVDAQKLFADNFRPAPNSFQPATARSGRSNQQSNFFKLYDAGNYAQALAAFPTGENDDNWLFFKANALLATGKTKEAARLLEGVVERSATLYTSKARWYLALAYVRLNENEKAVKALQLYALEADVTEKVRVKHIISLLR